MTNYPPEAKEVEELVSQLTEALRPVVGGELDTERLNELYERLHSLIETLRATILREKNPDYKLVAATLASLDEALQRLVEGNQPIREGLESELERNRALLTESNNLLVSVTKKARKAGDAWPL